MASPETVARALGTNRTTIADWLAGRVSQERLERTGGQNARRTQSQAQ